MEKKTQRITLNLDSSAVPLSRFKAAVTAFCDLLESVSNEYSKEGRPVNWSFSVEKGSAKLIACSDSPDAKIVADEIKVGMKELETGTIQDRPRHFSDASIKAAKKLASARSRGKGEIPIEIRVGRTRTQITKNTIEAATDYSKGQYQAYGEIEGRLKVITINDGFVFEIYQRLFRRRVRCVINNPELLDKAFVAFRAERRVRISGRIQYSERGTPVSISASRIFEFPSEESLPTIQQMRGILG